MKTVGIIGGSGLYALEGMKSLEEIRLQTPFGDPSDAYRVGQFADARLVFLPRHGRGHRIAPNEINFRANLYGLKELGCEWVISLSAVGSMREEIRPGDFVIADQFFDRTAGRPASFFGGGIVSHVSLADPVCPILAQVLYDAASPVGIRAHRSGTYLCIEGPQFSTRAESKIYRSWGVDVIGMTNLPEARLAREAELCYSTVALVTDYDCWHEGEEDVTLKAVLEIMKQNARAAQALVAEAIPRIAAERRCACREALKHAIVTDRQAISKEARSRVELLVGKYL